MSGNNGKQQVPPSEQIREKRVDSEKGTDGDGGAEIESKQGNLVDEVNRILPHSQKEELPPSSPDAHVITLPLSM